MDEIEKFKQEVQTHIAAIAVDQPLHKLSQQWMQAVTHCKYAYNFTWLGRPIIQIPQDVMALQELIWQVRPDLIVETGIAHGGSLILSASMLALLEYTDAITNGTVLDPKAPQRRVLGIDIDIRAHNRAAIQAHPLSHRIDMIQGSSIASDIIAQVHTYAKKYQRIMVCLDSNHTHEHVLAELEAYAPLVSLGSYCCVLDTVVEEMPETFFTDRPWGPGDNPKTAVWEYLRRLKEAEHHAIDGDRLQFEVDKTLENKLLLTVAPDGYLKRIKMLIKDAEV